MTNEEINHACAELCSWEWAESSDVDDHGAGWRRQGRFYGHTFSYCTDRNTLPELLTAIERDGKQEAFNSWFCFAANLDTFDHAGRVAIDILKADPRVVAESALRAVGRWKETTE